MHVCRYGRELEGGPRDQLTYLRTFLEGLAGRHERYFAAAKKMRGTIVFTGRLDHGELARLLPAAEETIVPSMFPEAFGMVAAEAAACGALPVCAGHSGLEEVASVLGEQLSPQVRELLTFERGMRAVEAIGAGDDRLAEMDERLRRSAREALVRTAAAALRLGVGGGDGRQRLTRAHGACWSRCPGRCRSPKRLSAEALRCRLIGPWTGLV